MIRSILLGGLLWAGVELGAQELRLGIPLSHALAPTQLAVSPDGSLAATGSPDRSIIVRETESGKSLLRLQGHQAAVNGLLFLDNQRLLSWSADGTLKIWNTRHGAVHLRHSLEDHRTPVRLVLQRGPALISSDASGRMVFWDTAKASVIEVLNAHEGPLLALQSLPDGRIFSADAQGGWMIWSYESPKGAVMLQQQGSLPRDTRLAAVGKDGSLLLATGDAQCALLPYSGGTYPAATGLLSLPVSAAERARFVPMHAFQLPSGEWMLFSTGAIVSLNAKQELKLLSEQPFARLLHATRLPESDVLFYSRSDGKLYRRSGSSETLFYPNAEALHFLPGNKGDLLCLLDGRFAALDANGALRYREREPAPLSMLSGSLPNSGLAYTVATDHCIRIWDPDNGKLVQLLRGHTGSVLSVASDSSGEILYSAGRDGKAIVWQVLRGSALFSHSFPAAVTDICPGPAPGSAYAELADGALYYLQAQTPPRQLAPPQARGSWSYLTLNRQADRLLVWNRDGRCDLYRWSDRKRLSRCDAGEGLVSALLLANGPVLGYSDGNIRYSRYQHFKKLQPLLSLPAPLQHMVALGGDTLAAATRVGSVHLLSLRSGLFRSRQLHTAPIIGLSVSGRRLLSADESGRCALLGWTKDTGLVDIRYPGGLMSAMLFREGQYALLAGMDQFLALHDGKDGHAMLRLLPMSGREWISLHPGGLFDATEAAMENMFWIRGSRILEFARLKARFWEPGLWLQVVNRQKLRDVQGFDRIGMHPDLEFGRAENGILPIRLQSNDGGIGRVAVYINGKEISADARGPGFNPQADSARLLLDLRQHPFLLAGRENEILVKTWTADGLVESRGAVMRYTAPPDPGKTARAPHFYGIVCGNGNYRNSEINLRYSVPDAVAIAGGIADGASKLFGRENTQVRLFTQPGARPGSRENLQAAFDSIAAVASPEDIVFVYLSGHGISMGGEDGEFYYLLPEAFSADAAAYTDPQLRQRSAIGTGELSRMLLGVKALKQILIIDACGSGKLVENLAGKREIAPVQIRAFDRMRDRTGTYILSGCAADAVSYEASRYGQGLLTYALLQGMAGASLREENLLDVGQWFQYARDRVPELARGIGGVQEPQLLLPRGGSIDIAMMDEDARRRIPLAQVKPVFIQSLVQDEAAFEDVLKIGELLDRRLFELSSRGVSAPIAFFEVKRFAQACQLFGRYSQEGDRIVFRGKIKCPDGEIAVTAEAGQPEQLVTQLVEQISKVK